MELTHLNALRALEAALRHGSFTAAADELGITPAAVGQRVRTLEDYLGAPLFERGATGIRPLAEAQEVAVHLTNGFSAVALALGRLRAGAGAQRLAVTLPASFAEHWLTPAIAEFYRRNAEIDLRLDGSNRDVDLHSEPFDFAIRYGSPPGDDLEAEDLFGDWVLPVCTADFAARHQLHPGVRSLKDVPLIHALHRTRDPGWLGFDGWGAAFGFDPAYLGHGPRYSTMSSGMQAAISSQGLVICGLAEAYHALTGGQLVLPFGPDLRCRTSYRYRLLRVPGRPLPPLQTDFRDWVLEKAAQYREGVAGLLGDVEIR